MARDAKSPQRKKALSYAKDRRNAYGQNDKAARKAIPARKAGENRRARRKAGHALAVIERLDAPVADMVESALRHDIERVGGWTKAADMPLGDYVASRKAWAERRIGSNARVRAEVERQRSAPDFNGMISVCSDIRFPPED
ncbi:hypothetical protein OMP43_21165 [Sphingomonas sp. CBMAI 2297]|uniref:hypothetical protein n=1 Tax=Sphingomonas sp. CBMAI 2297 TaxID=2991720 RepID=UPI00245434C8|nr:hypothetical protein [Sphingomonas sp. CBMAI 2297]MDH4746542.1 hypothetical protein [Sphingomonas sp. CBMAI 2297]